MLKNNSLMFYSIYMYNELFKKILCFNGKDFFGSYFENNYNGNAILRHKEFCNIFSNMKMYAARLCLYCFATFVIKNYILVLVQL